MTTTPAAPSIPVRLSGAADLARSLPGLLGFRPRDSLVLVGTSSLPHDAAPDPQASHRRSVRCAMRVDLPPEPDPALAADLLARAAVAGADEVLAVVVDGPPGPPWDWHEALLLADDGAGRVLDTLGLSGDRLWSAGCSDLQCCPPEGVVVPAQEHQGLTEQLAFAGRGVLPDREAVVKSARSDPPEEQGPLPDPAVVLRQVRDRRWHQVTPAGWRSAGRECVEVAYRDALLHALDGLPHDESVGCGLRLARAVGPTDADAGACAVLAWVAWRSGDGALALVAVERGLESDPTHRLCLLLEQVLEAGLPPDRA